MMKHFAYGICQHINARLYFYNTNSLYQIDKDRVIVGGMDKIYIVNIDKCVIEKTIKDESFRTFHCFLKLRDNHTILCGCSGGLLCYYDINTEKIKTIKKN